MRVIIVNARPKVITHNTVSVNGFVKGFEADIELHYSVAASFKPDAHLVGSVTALTGLEQFYKVLPEEEATMMKKPTIQAEDPRPYWVIPDTRGILEGKLHLLRGSGYCKDVVVLASKTTPQSYLDYLEEREYSFEIVGEKRVDLAKALEVLASQCGFKTVVTDSGGVLNVALLLAELVDEVSLIIAPVIVKPCDTPLFAHNMMTSMSSFSMRLLSHETLRGENIWLRYACQTKTATNNLQE